MVISRLAFPFLFLFLSCKNHTPVNADNDTTKTVTKDTFSNTHEIDYPAKYIEHARLEKKDWLITITSRFAVLDGKIDEEAHYQASSNYFVYLNKKIGKADTIEAGLVNLGGCQSCKFFIRDLTDSFKSGGFVVQIVTPAEDIYYTNSFVGYDKGKFQILFSIEDGQEEGIDLYRDGVKLRGKISGRDEVVDNLELDYPVEIDTRTFKVTYPQLEKQYIGWETTATESFLAHRVIAGMLDTSLVKVNAGTAVMVDTLYRVPGKVRLHVSDSIIVEVKVETAQKKLGHNNAG